MIAMRRAFTLAELLFVALIIGGLMVVVFRIYKTNADYETARQVDEFVKAVDKGLFMMNAILQNSSFRKADASNIEGDNGGLYLMVPNTSFEAVYRALMNGDCMVRCFDDKDNNNTLCGGNTADFNGMCDNNKLCLVGVLEKRYLNTYMIPKVLQGRVFFLGYTVKDPYEVVVDSKTGQKIVAGRLEKLTGMVITLWDAPQVARILPNMDSRYIQVRGTRMRLLSFDRDPNSPVIFYPLNNNAGHLVIVRSGYVCR